MIALIVVLAVAAVSLGAWAARRPSKRARDPAIAAARSTTTRSPTSATRR